MDGGMRRSHSSFPAEAYTGLALTPPPTSPKLGYIWGRGNFPRMKTRLVTFLKFWSVGNDGEDCFNRKIRSFALTIGVGFREELNPTYSLNCKIGDEITHVNKEDQVK